MKKIFLMVMLCGMIHAEENTPSPNQRIERRYLAFKNISDYWITIITLDNRRITLRPHDYEWTGFSIGWEPITIAAQLAPGIVIHDTFGRESDDESKWLIQVFKPNRKIIIRRLREQDL